MKQKKKERKWKIKTWLYLMKGYQNKKQRTYKVILLPTFK